jgi:Mg2+-importing ATPase
VLRRQRRLRHFGRHALLGTLAGHGPTAAAPEHMARDLLRAAREDGKTAIARLKSHDDGLSAREATARLARSGPNEVEQGRPLHGWLHLWHCYANPFNLLLTALAVVSYLTQDAKATVVIAAMVLLSTAIRFVQEDRSHRAAESPKAMVSNKVTVIRGGRGNGRAWTAPGDPASRVGARGTLWCCPRVT